MEVWRAWDELLGRPVAVKLPASARTDGQRQAFQEGVNRAAGLSHPALETVYDSDQARDAASGRLVSYVVTEFLDGETLAERLRRGPLTASETARVCAGIAGALDAAHRAGAAHGALTPDKVMLIGGDVKVTDTGLSGGLAPGIEGEAADVRALGAIISACLPRGTSGEPAAAAIAVRCLRATVVDGPSAAQIARLLDHNDGPANAVFTPRNDPAPGTGPARDHRTKNLRAPHREAGVRPATVLALVVAIPATAAVAILVSAPRSPATPPSPVPASSAVRDMTGVAGLRPIVSRGYTSGDIRSDAAIDLTNLITNLENALAASDRKPKANRRDVNRQIARLQDEIGARQKERTLSRDVASELNRVLASIQA